jgi:hypothetical protein
MKSRNLTLTVGMVFSIVLVFSPVALARCGSENDLIATIPQSPQIYKLEDAGIQVEGPCTQGQFPCLWGRGERSNLAGHMYVFTKEEDNTYIATTIYEWRPPESLSLSLDDAFKQVWTVFTKEADAGGFTELDLKDVKSVGAVEKITQNGMPLIKQRFNATHDGSPVAGVVAALKGKGPAIIVSFGTASAGSAFSKEFERVMNSIKKIQ